MGTGIRIVIVGMEIRKQFGSDIKKRLCTNLIYLVRKKED